MVPEQSIKIGDKVRTPNGVVIRVEGVLISKVPLYDAAHCELLDPQTKTTAEEGKDVHGLQEGTDAIVWGS